MNILNGILNFLKSRKFLVLVTGVILEIVFFAVPDLVEFRGEFQVIFLGGLTLIMWHVALVDRRLGYLDIPDTLIIPIVTPALTLLSDKVFVGGVTVILVGLAVQYVPSLSDYTEQLTYILTGLITVYFSSVHLEGDKYYFPPIRAVSVSPDFTGEDN